MNRFWIASCAASAMVLIQFAVVGLPLYHFGWYNVLCVILLAVAAAGLRTRRTSFIVAFAGAAAIVVAGVAAGLLAPDTHAIVGAPGTIVSDPQTGTAMAFPAVAPRWRRRYAASRILETIPRYVVAVRAKDLRGNELTITQPSNASFLSPVLLMQQDARIAGMAVSVDSFALPALDFTVKAVLLDARQAARLHVSTQNVSEPAVLFAVASDGDRPIPGAIGIVPSGDQRRIGPVRLSAQVERYPAILVASAPYVAVVAAGLAAFAGGALLGLKTRSRSKT